jgi:hypothetical protein
MISAILFFTKLYTGHFFIRMWVFK